MLNLTSKEKNLIAEYKAGSITREALAASITKMLICKVTRTNLVHFNRHINVRRINYQQRCILYYLLSYCWGLSYRSILVTVHSPEGISNHAPVGVADMGHFKQVRTIAAGIEKFRSDQRTNQQLSDEVKYMFKYIELRILPALKP